MMVSPKDVDEVMLALNAAFSALSHNGHKPLQNFDSCGGCHAMHLLRRALEIYPVTRVVRIPFKE